MSGKRELRESKPKMKTRTKFVIVSIFNLTWYTVAVLCANFHDHVVQTELTVAWFSAWTIELALLAGIKLKSKSSDSTTL
ncbi:MAG: hypothetical protein IKB82_00530 [Clostridia bacterium]|nr:hypothetical protein [Clostridia bacterium]